MRMKGRPGLELLNIYAYSLKILPGEREMVGKL
jgi:hypothetical protein